jgi:hypothetical protein
MGFFGGGADALTTALGAAPDADALTYINANSITGLEEKVGISRLVTFLKDNSLWATAAGVFIFGNRVGAASGTSLPDLRGGSAATLTGGTHNHNGIFLSGPSANQISFGARTFTNNFMPSVYLLFTSYNRTGTTTSHRINFGPLSQQSLFRGFCPHTHVGTGSSTSVHLHCFRGDGNRYFNNVLVDARHYNGRFVGAAFSSADQKILGADNSDADNATSASATTLSFAAGATWLLGPFEQSSTTSTELTTVSACLFWDSNTTLSVQIVSQLDTLLRQFVTI